MVICSFDVNSAGSYFPEIQAADSSVNGTIEYDKLHVQAFLDWLDGKDPVHSEGSLGGKIPNLFGGNFQASMSANSGPTISTLIFDSQRRGKEMRLRKCHRQPIYRLPPFHLRLYRRLDGQNCPEIERQTHSPPNPHNHRLQAWQRPHQPSLVRKDKPRSRHECHKG